MSSRREFILLLGGALSAFHCVSASAQEGYYGAGHDKWHQGFYSNLKRNDGQGSCCNLMDCRPTQSRMVGDHFFEARLCYGLAGALSRGQEDLHEV